MKRLSILSALLLAWGVSGGAKADDKVRARLMGFQEVPVVSTVGSGTFEAVINRNGDAIDYELTYTGMQGTVTQSHMHVGQRSVNGGIVLWICGTTPGSPGPAGTPVCTSPNGHFAGTWRPENVQTVATQQITTGELDEVIAAIRASVAYVNVHTNLSPAGEIRGQVRANRRD
jgi:CHRD domain-containing protein